METTSMGFMKNLGLRGHRCTLAQFPHHVLTRSCFAFMYSMSHSKKKLLRRSTPPPLRLSFTTR